MVTPKDTIVAQHQRFESCVHVQPDQGVVSGFKGLENDVVILAALTDIETDWHRGVAYVGMSRARTRLHVVIHEDCDGKRR